jgi:predicted GTPase
MTEMTVVFVGKQGAGKSSTLNSVLNERVAASAPFQPESLRPLLAGRTAAGFTLNLLDTPGLLEGDQVSTRGMASVKLALKDREVHAVVYMDRLDAWRVDNSDKAGLYKS